MRSCLQQAGTEPAPSLTTVILVKRASCIFSLPAGSLTSPHGKGTPWAWCQLPQHKPRILAKPRTCSQSLGDSPLPRTTSICTDPCPPIQSQWDGGAKVNYLLFHSSFTCGWAFWIQSGGLPLIKLNQMCVFTRCFHQQIIFPARLRCDNDGNSNFWSEMALESFPAIILCKCQHV